MLSQLDSLRRFNNTEGFKILLREYTHYPVRNNNEIDVESISQTRMYLWGGVYTENDKNFEIDIFFTIFLV